MRLALDDVSNTLSVVVKHIKGNKFVLWFFAVNLTLTELRLFILGKRLVAIATSCMQSHNQSSVPINVKDAMETDRHIPSTNTGHDKGRVVCGGEFKRHSLDTTRVSVDGCKQSCENGRTKEHTNLLGLKNYRPNRRPRCSSSIRPRSNLACLQILPTRIFCHGLPLAATQCKLFVARCMSAKTADCAWDS